MLKDECFNLGYVSRTWSYKGQVVIFLDVTYPEDYKKLESVFVEIDEQLVPFFIQTLKMRGKGFAQIQFEGIDNEQAALRLVKKKLYLPDALLPKLNDKQYYNHELPGLILIDHEEGRIGRIREIYDQTLNPIIEVDYEGKDILIPLNDTTFISIDREKEEFHMKLPEGLLNLAEDASDHDDE